MNPGEVAPTRERILTAAIDVMRGKGVGAATTRAIAAEAGISEALIYRYFKNKVDVLRTAVREYVGLAFADTIAALPEHVGRASATANVERVATAALTFYHDLIPLLASLFSDNALIEWYRSSLREHDSGPHRAIRLLGEYLAAEQRLGRIGPDVAPQAAAQMVLGACFQHVFFALTVGPDRLGFTDPELAAAVARSIAGRQENTPAE